LSRLRSREFLNLVAGKQRTGAQWFSIKNQASGPVQVSIFDEIGYWGVTAQEFCDQLAKVDGPVDLYLNSPGGEIFDGITIYNALLRRDVAVFVEGIAASAASFIAQAAVPGKLGMAKTASMMIHNGMSVAFGDAEEMRKTADVLEAQTRNIAEIYSERSGQPVDDLLAMMSEETWLRAADAVGKGLADYVYDPRSGPVNVLARRPAPGIANAAADESAWDASRAWANGAASDDPAAFYDGICAGKKAGDPATQAAHALPHHYHPGDAPNRHGVSAALGRIGSTDGLTNEAAARAHLEAHQSAMGGGADNYAVLTPGEFADFTKKWNVDWLDQAAFIEAFKEATK
jgi:ATP-dependent protease ClpP protease subunit